MTEDQSRREETKRELKSLLSKYITQNPNSKYVPSLVQKAQAETSALH